MVSHYKSNLKIFVKKDSDKYFLRNISNIDKKGNLDKYYFNLFKNLKINPKSFLDIGCGNGHDLNNFRNKLIKDKFKTRFYGIDTSELAIKYCKKKFTKINFLKISSLEIEKIKKKFDFINFNWMLYLLDRESIYKQLDITLKCLNKNSYIGIIDFYSQAPIVNNNIHAKNLVTYKMNYDKIITGSYLFKRIYHKNFNADFRTNQKFKNNKIFISIYKKIEFGKK